MPIAFAAGGRDAVVPPHSVQRLAEAVRKTNASVLVLYREEGGHETNLADTIEAMEFVVRGVLSKT